jgi:UDPglucose 6-dehydrogenase|tara:strand:+ start:69 stop:809 length:741 start_codon:yes stop_codon:yes gene_type:complete
MNKFGILGYGYVGKATHKGLLKDGTAIIYDTIFDLDKRIIYAADTVFICIPTNTDEDIKIIIDEIKDLQEHNSNVKIIIRSTLPLGSCTRIQEEVGSIIYMPEFLRERYWDTDCLNRPLVVGCDVADFLPEWLEQEEIHKCSTNEAELVKMFSNNYAVMRIAFANVFYDLANSVGADYNVVKEMFFKIEPNQTYMNVPGHDGTRGFGGKCLPKDLDFLIETLDNHNIDQNWFKHIRELNKGWTEKF